MLDLYTEVLLDHLEVLVVIFAGLLCYLFFFFADHSVVFGRLFKALRLQPGSVKVLSSRLGGLLWLGVVPLLFLSLVSPVISLSWLGFYHTAETWFWLLILVPLPWLLAVFTSRSGRHRQQYPEVREKVWDRRLLVVDLLCWALYLLGYEAFFRGVMLFGLIGSMDVWLVVAINTLFYSLVHLPKGAGETVGSIPLGILLCLVSLTTGSFWIAFLVHLSMAWSNELMSLRHHTEIQSPVQRRSLWQ